MSVARADRPETAALRAVLAAMPGAEGAPAVRGVTLYKVMGKMFAILEDNKLQCVILKCDPHLAEILREQYAGVGRRSHLDPRFWICVTLDADVAAEEIARLAAASYDLVRAGLTKTQKAALATLAAG
jgi:predicted DNA-binding protein (MmcQ/YjbR family)